MRHVTALIMKFVMLTVVLGITLGLLGGATFGQVLLASLVLTAVAYAIGDLMILPATQNWVAVAADAVIAWAILRFVAPAVATGGPLLWSIVAIALGEFFFHNYVQESVLQPSQPSQ